ncbi:class I SAM-dependent methyltransferase [Halostella salina]|uniref:class I SAM-dependent methyltransferase n=1 Tax=Halostella salina TaxID=1547897 RepID=UPI000EF7FA9C|nr:class I SAM-dependent methyltransferase [Halostella salina]
MDWEQFYREADYDRCAYLAGEEMADLLARFLERVAGGGGAGGNTGGSGEFPADLASFGCGPAVVPFALAERYPDLDVYGYDLSETVVRDNRRLADERGLDNLSFAVDELPDLSTDRRFDVVYCVATLYFVADPEPALRALYDRVRPGGHLIVNYPTAELQQVVREEFDERKREAFHLVRDGENLITCERVGEVLDAEPRDYWAAVDADDVIEETPESPVVYVEKPDGDG